MKVNRHKKSVYIKSPTVSSDLSHSTQIPDCMHSEGGDVQGLGYLLEDLWSRFMPTTSKSPLGF